MQEELDVADRGTITRWRRDPRVKELVGKLNADRALAVSSKVDSVIQGRLSQAEDMEVKDLIAIRKEYGGPAVARNEVDSDAVTQAMKALEDNPELADQLEEFLENASKPAEPAKD